MNTKTVWNASNATPEISQESPLEPGVYLIPVGAVETEPPTFDRESKVCSWADDKWVVSDIPIIELPPKPDPVPAMDQLRSRRNGLLFNTDWWMHSDTPSPSQAQLDYRQALRDLPATANPSLDGDGMLTGVTFPSQPS